jgi:hypothetical protein
MINTSFKIYDPVAQLVATGAGSGGGLPLTGGALSGNLTMTFPTKIQQSQAPSVGDDLVNKTYADGLVVGSPFLPLVGGTLVGNVSVASPNTIQQSQAPSVGDDLVNKTYADGSYQAKKPAAVANNVAFFGSGPDVGQTIDSGYSVDTVLANQPSNTTLWPSSRMIGSLQYGADVYKSTASVTITSGSSTRAFSSGNSTVGPSTWPNLGSTFSLASTGIATISNSLQYTTYFRLIFSANSLSDSALGYGTLNCQFQDENGPTLLGVVKTLKVFPSPPSSFCTCVYFSVLIAILPVETFNFSVLLTNSGSNDVTIDSNLQEDPSLLIIERVA